MYSYFLNNQGKIIHKWLHYFPIYEQFFERFKNQSIIFWEIGVYKGGSLKMWKSYFGPLATIIGIDIDPSCKNHEEDSINVRIGSQTDTSFLQRVIDEFGRPDIVLDDGSHVMDDVNKTFDFLFPRLNNNGIYMVEDMHTAYWENYGGGLNKKDTFIEKAKAMIDTLNAYHYMSRDAIPDFTKQCWSMTFFDSVVVFEKKYHTRPKAIKTGTI